MSNLLSVAWKDGSALNQTSHPASHWQGTQEPQSMSNSWSMDHTLTTFSVGSTGVRSSAHRERICTRGWKYPATRDQPQLGKFYWNTKVAGTFLVYLVYFWTQNNSLRLSVVVRLICELNLACDTAKSSKFVFQWLGDSSEQYQVSQFIKSSSPPLVVPNRLRRVRKVGVLRQLQSVRGIKGTNLWGSVPAGRPCLWFLTHTCWATQTRRTRWVFDVCSLSRLLCVCLEYCA